MHLCRFAIGRPAAGAIEGFQRDDKPCNRTRPAAECLRKLRAEADCHFFPLTAARGAILKRHV